MLRGFLSMSEKMRRLFDPEVSPDDVNLNDLAEAEQESETESSAATQTARPSTQAVNAEAGPSNTQKQDTESPTVSDNRSVKPKPKRRARKNLTQAVNAEAGPSNAQKQDTESSAVSDNRPVRPKPRRPARKNANAHSCGTEALTSTPHIHAVALQSAPAPLPPLTSTLAPSPAVSSLVIPNVSTSVIAPTSLDQTSPPPSSPLSSPVHVPSPPPFDLPPPDYMDAREQSPVVHQPFEVEAELSLARSDTHLSSPLSSPNNLLTPPPQSINPSANDLDFCPSEQSSNHDNLIPSEPSPSPTTSEMDKTGRAAEFDSRDDSSGDMRFDFDRSPSPFSAFGPGASTQDGDGE